MRDHLIRRVRCEKAQIVTARGLVVGCEPIDLVGVPGTHVYLLAAEYERGARGLATAGIEHSDLHSENPGVPLGRACHVADIDHEMVDRTDFHRHGSSFHPDAWRPRTGHTFPHASGLLQRAPLSIQERRKRRYERCFHAAPRSEWWQRAC